MGLDKLPDVVTIRQLAEFLQVSKRTIQRAITSGKLKAFKVERDWRIEKEAIIKWINLSKG
jgi:excisionase family DNA binding protein